MTEARCGCTDCVENQQGMCVAQQIQLDRAPDGGCQCLSYQPGQQAAAPSQQMELGLGAALGE